MTEKLFYRDPYLREATARVIDVKKNGGKIALLLERTIFYPEGGGQPSDRGWIEGENFRMEVKRVYGKDGVWHEGHVEGEVKPGETVRLVLDWEWRYENMRNHTGQHLLSALIKGILDADTTGFQIFESHNKIEIDYPGELNWELIFEIERKTNELVWGDLPVEVAVYEELPEELRRSLRKGLSQKVRPPIRVVEIGNVDLSPCGGTHVRSTREIGLVKVLNFYRKSRKLWRIEFASGNRALKYLDGILEDYWGSLNEMPNKNRPLLERVGELKGEIERLEVERDALRRELWEWKAKALLGSAEEIGGIRVVSHVERTPLKDAQAFAVHLVDKNPNTVALIVGENYAVFAKNREVEGISMEGLLKEVLSKTGGGGGGSEVLARGGGFKVAPEKVLGLAREILKERLTR